MNIAFATHRLWQLWKKGETVPPRPPLWPAPVKAFFYLENEHRQPEVLEVWAAAIVNGKPEVGAWAYDVKACSLIIKERGLYLSGAEIQEGWPSEEVPALSVKQPEPELEAPPIACPACELKVPPVEWQKKLVFPAHDLPNGNDCEASYKPITWRPNGAMNGLEKLMMVVPQTYGEAVQLYPSILEKIPGHEWDNRTTTENAEWLIRELILLAFPVDPAPTAKTRRRSKRKGR